MSNPTKFTKASPQFNTVNAQNEALVKSTGKSIHELMAEAVEVERQKMLSTGESKEYIRLITTIFGKFSVGAPQHVITEDLTPPPTREEVKAKIDNYLTRIALGTASTPETPTDNN